MPRPPLRRSTIALRSASCSASTSCGRSSSAGRSVDRLDRVLGHEARLAALELAVVVLEGVDRRVGDPFLAHLLNRGAQPFVAHRGDASRRRNAPAPSTSRTARAHARGQRRVGGDDARRRRCDEPDDLVVGRVAPARAARARRSRGPTRPIKSSGPASSTTVTSSSAHARTSSTSRRIAPSRSATSRPGGSRSRSWRR